MTALRVARASPAATGSSSSPAATTATPTRCWQAPARTRDAGHPVVAGRPDRRGSGHDRLPLQRRRRAAAAVAEWRERLACVIVEPVAGNMGVVPPEPGFLETLRSLRDASGALLVFDEVISGFRVARGGAQERYGITPDLTSWGRSSAAACRWRPSRPADVMDVLAPAGEVYQAGTLSGNPLAAAAGLAVLRRLRDPAVYEGFKETGARLEAGLAPYGRVQRVGAMLTLFAQDERVRHRGCHGDEALRQRPPSARAGDLLGAVQYEAMSSRPRTGRPRWRRWRRCRLLRLTSGA